MTDIKELKEEDLKQVSGGEYTDENGHVFAYAPGFFYIANNGHGIEYRVEECYVENGVNKYKLSVTAIGIRCRSFIGYDYLTESELTLAFLANTL